MGRYAFPTCRDGEGAGSRSESLPGPAPHLFLNSVVLNPRTARYTAAIPDALDHPRSQSTISAAPRSFANSQKPSALTNTASTSPKATALGACGSGIGGHDLVNTLTAEAEIVGNLRQGLSPKTSLPDVVVPCGLTARTRPQRTPLPSGKHLQGTDTIGRKFTFSMSLPGVVDPIAKPQLFPIDDFDMDRRDFTMVFAHSKLIERTNVQKELLRMIHTSTLEGDGKDHNSYRSLPGYGGGNHGF